MPRTAKKSARRTMTNEHKAAIAAARLETSAVRNYLEGLESHQPRRGRPRDPESIRRRLKEIDGQLQEATPLQRLSLIQRRLDLEAELAALDAGTDISELEVAFVKYASAYSSRKGISYSAWRSVGVEPRVLAEAGITRSRG